LSNVAFTFPFTRLLMTRNVTQEARSGPAETHDNG